MSVGRQQLLALTLLLLLSAGAWLALAPASPPWAAWRPPTPTSAASSASRPLIREQVPPSIRRPIRVAFIDMFEPHNPFRRQVLEVMRAAAHDLGIDLIEHTATYWPGDTLELIGEVVTGPQKPDYLLIAMYRSIGVGALEVAERAGVPVFIVYSGLLPEERARFGGPRQHFKSWLGVMQPDNEQVGYQLAHYLIDAAIARDAGPPERPVRLVALEGRRGDLSAMQRNAGLRRALAERADARLLQRVPVRWNPELAHRKMNLLLRRYPDLQVVWAANDDLALAAADSLEQAGRHPGEDVLLGGVDWTRPGLEAVREGRLVVSLGGHFLEGGWALVLLHDHHHGLDFASEQIEWRTQMAALTRDNVDAYLQSFGDGNWEKIDFRAFSKVANPGLKHYDFSLQALFEQQHAYVPSPEHAP